MCRISMAAGIRSIYKQGRIQDFPKGGLRPAIRNAGRSGGGGGCCPLQVRYEKRGGGGVLSPILSMASGPIRKAEGLGGGGGLLSGASGSIQKAGRGGRGGGGGGLLNRRGGVP